MMRKLSVLFIMGFGGLSLLAQEVAYDDIWELSIEELLNTPITTASRGSQRWFEVPAAVSVVHGSEIEDSGFRNIPDILRYVPGMNVGQGNNTMWSVGARGLTGFYSNKLLVLKDGMSIYSPVFSGVVWDGTHGNMEDIDRIEVVRGPGGTTWGMNAMNAVVNILSKSAFDTLGGKFATGLGSTNNTAFALRYGGLIANGDSGAFRVSLKHSVLDGGPDGYDDGTLLNGSFRFDQYYDTNKEITITAEINDNRMGTRTFVDDVASYPFNFVDSDAKHRTRSLTGQWKVQNEASSFVVKSFTRSTSYQSDLVGWDQITFDVEAFAEDFRFESQKLTYGIGVRHSQVKGRNTLNSGWGGTNVDGSIYSFFAEDEISMFNETLSLVVGTKLEYLTVVDQLEYEPRVGLSYIPNESTHWWLRASRSLRTPSLGERGAGAIYGGTQPLETPVGTVLGRIRFFLPDEGVEPEIANTYEAGFRKQITPDLLFDATVFKAFYYDVVANEDVPDIQFQSTFPPSALVVYELMNSRDRRTEGVELSLRYMVNSEWDVSVNYAYIDQYRKGSKRGVESDKVPAHSVQLSVRCKPHVNWVVFVGGRYVSKTHYRERSLPAQFQADFNIRYLINERFSVGLSGHSVLDSQFSEYDLSSDVVHPLSELEREFILKLDYSF